MNIFSRDNMIVLMMLSLFILADAGPTLLESSTHDTEVYKTCQDDYDCYDYDVCCDKGDGKQCMSAADCITTTTTTTTDCIGIDEGTLWGIGIAGVVASFLVPILCCCCCGGCALYWLLKRRKDRRGQDHQPGVHMMQPGMQMMQGGQVQQQGYPTAGFAAPQPGYEQGGQAGGLYPSVQNPENVK